ncbi:MAG TPA: PQQ-binding-like beta-propeller repeat protein [Pirellulales bacterium]|nr:PQQ-binding-like beta-propeller repeat protein [Pirellulales bacterium]
MTRRLFRLCVMVLLGSAMVSTVQAQESAAEARWPQFRGPSGQGIAVAGMEFPTEFGPSKNVVWKTSLPSGHSSPCVWDDRIFVTCFEPETKQLETICLDRASGAIVWRRAAPADKIEKMHELNSPAASTPTTDGQRVYVYFGSYGLLCYDREGVEQWRRPMPPIQGYFGSGTSPVAAGVFVLLNSGFGPNYSVLAIDGKTGNTVWQKDRGRGFSTGLWSSPVVRHVDGGDEVLVVGGELVASYRLADGAERWKVKGLPLISLNTPALGDGLMFLSLTDPFGDADNIVTLPTGAGALEQYDKNGDGKIATDEVPADFNVFGRGRADKIGDWTPLRQMMGRHDKDKDGALDRDEWQALADSLVKIVAGLQLALVGVKLDGTGDVSATHVAWRQSKAVPEVPSPLYYEERVYLVSERGIVTCREAATGKELYRQRLGARGTCYASPVIGGGKIYAAGDGGTVVVFKAGDAFEVLATNEFDEGIMATPALVDGKIYLRTARHMYAFGQ